MQILQGGDRARVNGITYADAAWEGNKRETELDNHGPHWGAMHLQDRFLNRQGTEELLHLGVSGTVGNVDGDDGSFLSQACTGNCHHIVGGKPPPYTVTLVQYAGTLESTERAAPCYRPVRQGGRE